MGLEGSLPAAAHAGLGRRMRRLLKKAVWPTRAGFAFAYPGATRLPKIVNKKAQAVETRPAEKAAAP